MTDSKDKGFGSASPESVCPHCRAEGFVRVSPFVLRTGRHLHWHWHLLSPRLGWARAARGRPLSVSVTDREI